MTEADLQRTVIDAARLHGFRVAHFRPALSQSGRWSTPVQADGAGWPDLSIAGHGALIFAEIKSTKGRLRPEQHAWLNTLEHVVERPTVRIWRPADADAALELLSTIRREAA